MYTAERRERLTFAKGAHKLYRNVAKSITGTSAVGSGVMVITGVIDVLLEKTRDLVQLEAVNAFLNWQAASKKVELAKTRFESGKKMVQLSRDNAQNIKKHDVLILNEALAAESQAEYLETVFEQLKALTSLERVTAGGVKPAFPSLDIAR